MKILVFPKDSNPYQQLLYKNIKEIEIKYLIPLLQDQVLLKFLLLPVSLFFYRFKGFNVFHLHWIYTFSYRGNPFLTFLYKVFFVIYIPLLFVFIRLIGYKIVWTIHNIVSHEQQTINDLFISRFLSWVSNEKIVHSNESIKQMKSLSLSTKRTQVIPIGNYNEMYLNTILRQEARKILKIKKNEIVFMYFGFIRKYKGIEKLLDDFISIQNKFTNVKLIIVGKCLEDDLKKKIVLCSKKYSNSIHCELKHIENDEVQLFFNSADVAVFPFTSLTTSSSVLLAFSFRIPVIYPFIGGLKDLPNDIGYRYNPQDEKGLYNSIVRAIKSKEELPKLGKSGYEFSKTLSWDVISKKTLKLYKRLDN